MYLYRYIPLYSIVQVFAVEFIGFAVEFGALALEFVAFAQKFVIVTLAATNQLLITRWTVFTMENTT